MILGSVLLAMQHFGVSIGAGALLLLAVVARLASRRRDIHRGLHAVIFFLVVYFGVRVALMFVPAWDLSNAGGEPTMTAKVLTAVMLAALSFSVLRLIPLFFFDYLARRRQHASVPRIIRDVVVAALYIVAGLTIIATIFPHVNLSSFVAGAGVMSLVLGLALQDTLGNVFAGLALQAERPFEPGDWITVGETTGRVTEVDWRATKVIDWNQDILVIPNSVIGRTELINHSRPKTITGCKISVGVSYDSAPNEVVQILEQVLAKTPGVLSQPEPWVRLVNFSDNSATYMLRFYAASLIDRYKLEHRVRMNVWYALRRKKVQIQIPIRTIRQLPAEPPEPPEEVTEALLAELQTIDFLEGVALEDLRAFASACDRVTYGAGETVIREGDPGTDCYLIVSGELEVVFANGGTGEVIATLGPGDHFGEISALSGDPRTSTVIAKTDVDLIVAGGRSLKALLQGHPEAAERLGTELEKRRDEIVTRSAQTSTPSHSERPAEGQILRKLKQLLGLD